MNLSFSSIQRPWAFVSSLKIFVAFLIWFCVLLLLQTKERSLLNLVNSLDPDSGFFSFASFMQQSFFEGNSWGGGDFASLLLVLLGIYLLFWPLAVSILNGLEEQKSAHVGGLGHKMGLPSRKQKILFLCYSPVIRVSAGLLFIYGMVVSVVLVHGLKSGVGRARPYVVLPEPHLYTPWYAPGALLPEYGSVNGSLPSGHTATVMIFFGLACVLIGFFNVRQKAKNISLTRILLLFLGLLPAGVMGISRVFSRAHWPTDVWISLGFGVLCWPLLSNALCPKRQLAIGVPDSSFNPTAHPALQPLALLQNIVHPKTLSLKSRFAEIVLIFWLLAFSQAFNFGLIILRLFYFHGRADAATLLLPFWLLASYCLLQALKQFQCVKMLYQGIFGNSQALAELVRCKNGGHSLMAHPRHPICAIVNISIDNFAANRAALKNLFLLLIMVFGLVWGLWKYSDKTGFYGTEKYPQKISLRSDFVFQQQAFSLKNKPQFLLRELLFARENAFHRFWPWAHSAVFYDLSFVYLPALQGCLDFGSAEQQKDCGLFSVWLEKMLHQDPSQIHQKLVLQAAEDLNLRQFFNDKSAQSLSIWNVIIDDLEGRYNEVSYEK